MTPDRVDPAEEKDLKLTMVAADPQFTTEDLLEEEASIIQEAFAAEKTHVNITTVTVSTEDDLLEHARSNRPDVLHFTGHGSPSRQIVLRTVGGPLRRKTGKSLARILKNARVAPRCIVFNNCSVFRSEGTLLSVCDNLVRMKPYEAFDYSAGFARVFYASFAKTHQFSTACTNTISAMREARVLNSVEIEFRRGGVIEAELPQRGIEFDATTIDIPRHLVEPYTSDSGDTAAGPSPKTIPSESDLPRKFRVWFGTNRKPLGLDFGSERDDKIHYGTCEVAIPKHHRIGSLGTSWWRRWPTWQDDRLRLLSTSHLEANKFWPQLQENIATLTKDERTILLFVHGYNVSFGGAALRAAQFGADLKVAGPTAFFSWPSKGRVKDYAADGASIEGSEGLLREFLERLAVLSGAERIHIIAHSMGNRGTSRAFNTLLSNVPRNLKVRFSQVFLAAPDIDVQLFKQIAVAYPKLSERTTMYISARDKALWGSSFLHDYPRAGYKPPTTVVDGIDTVEVSNIDLSFLGHGYIATARTVLQDMYALMLSNTPPERRMGIEAISDFPNGPKYWRIHA